LRLVVPILLPNFRRLVLCLTPLFAIASCGKSNQSSQAKAGGAGPGARGGGPPAPQVGIVTVSAASVPESYEFVGQVEPFRRVEVRSRVDGIVIDRPFTEGSFVEKGQILYKLDQVKY